MRNMCVGGVNVENKHEQHTSCAATWIKLGKKNAKSKNNTPKSQKSEKEQLEAVRKVKETQSEKKNEASPSNAIIYYAAHRHSTRT